MAFDWSSLIGPALQLGGSLLEGRSNQNAAQTQQSAGQFRPYNIFGPAGTAQFSGQNINLGLDPNQAALNGMLQQGGAGLFGQYLNSATQGPGNLGELAGEFDYANQFGDPNQALGLGNSFLAQLGSTDPNQLASSYATNLRNMERPGEQNAANSLATRLFSQGKLGSTGGQGMFGQLMQQQNQAEIQRQIAGQQYGQQAQQHMGQMGVNLQNQGYGRVQDRFARAQSLFCAGQQAQGGLLGGALGAWGMNNNNNAQLLNMAQLGGNIGIGAAQTNFAAGQPMLDARQANNASLYGGIGNVLGSIDWGGLMRPQQPVPSTIPTRQMGPL